MDCEFRLYTFIFDLWPYGHGHMIKWAKTWQILAVDINNVLGTNSKWPMVDDLSSSDFTSRSNSI